MPVLVIPPQPKNRHLIVKRLSEELLNPTDDGPTIVQDESNAEWRVYAITDDFESVPDIHRPGIVRDAYRHAYDMEVSDRIAHPIGLTKAQASRLGLLKEPV
ncbi:hypothetical protein BH11ARM2_BH11ARM2_33750 [soil metagenome]